MIAELGHFAVILALAASLWQSLVPLYGAHVNDTRLMRAVHPDKGGTAGLAAQLNAARDRLLSK